MNFDSWVQTVPDEIKDDPLWKMRVYRLSLFAVDIGWRDVSKLSQDKRTLRLSDQLYRALGSISANIAEGYSRSSAKDRFRFYEYALGSARESRDWYYKARHLLGEPVMTHRIQYLTQIIRLLLTILPRKNQTIFREQAPTYTSKSEPTTNLNDLLDTVPF